MKTKAILLLFGITLLILLNGSYKLENGSYKLEKVSSIVDFKNRFVKVDNNFYADKFEVTVQDYQLFLKERKEKGLDNSLVMYDSTLWLRKNGSQVNTDLYFNNPYLNSNPIVCITYSAANEFCNWLTKKYNSAQKREFKNVVFRLPTEKEFIKTAISIYDSQKIHYPWGYNGLYATNSDKKLCNFQELSQEKLTSLKDGRIDYEGFLPNNSIYRVGSFAPNSFGVYDIVGNVSEMIQEDGVAMGGDFCSLGGQVRIKSKKNYKKNDITVGFRVYMEVIEF
jgi:formylglycine-generating enzyme required for sulfatase activity